MNSKVLQCALFLFASIVTLLSFPALAININSNMPSTTTALPTITPPNSGTIPTPEIDTISETIRVQRGEMKGKDADDRGDLEKKTNVMDLGGVAMGVEASYVGVDNNDIYLLAPGASGGIVYLSMILPPTREQVGKAENFIKQVNELSGIPDGIEMDAAVWRNYVNSQFGPMVQKGNISLGFYNAIERQFSEAVNWLMDSQYSEGDDLTLSAKELSVAKQAGYFPITSR